MLWVVLVLDLAVWSPPPAPGQDQWVLEALTGQWSGKNPATVALFNVMGIWPLLYASRFVYELRARPIPAWPFILGGMGLGAFVIFPYLFMQPTPPAGRDPGPVLRGFGSPVVQGLLLLSIVVMLAWGAIAGDLSGFVAAWRTEQLVQVMSLDFVALALVFGISWVRGVSSK
ncbi:MAG: DUF2834 domain-containing protein [Myxococcota bacterium]